MEYCFAKDIVRFNSMYRMLVSDIPTVDIGEDLVQRLRNFKSILIKEINEMDDIITKARDPNVRSLEVLTDLADLLGDIQVYCASEMAKFGLPLNKVLSIIMQSNFSKMGNDGNPIYDEEGKLLKGPGYWKPEPAIGKVLESIINQEQVTLDLESIYR